MNKSAIYYIFFLVFILGCSERNDRKEVKEILGVENTNVDFKTDDLIDKSAYRRGRSDIVDNLFQEEVKSNEDLKSLMSRIKEVTGLTKDSTGAVAKYLDINAKYYQSAKRNLSYLRDSTLRSEMKTIFAKEEAILNKKMSLHKKLLVEISNSQVRLEDRKILVKLFVTLPLIKKYQTDKMPDIDQLKNIKKDIEALILESEKLIDIE